MSSIPSMQSSRKINYTTIADGEYEARIVRVIGLGVHKQKPWTDRKTGVTTQKNPAFRMDVAFEILGVDTKATDSDGKELDPRPACQFKSYYVNPRAKNSGMLDLIRMIDPSVEALKTDLTWYRDMLLGQPVNVLINSYTNQEGDKKNSIKSLAPIPTKYRSNVAAARCDLVFFEPYADTDENAIAYSNMFPFQRNMLLEATDTANIPMAGREVPKPGDTEQKEAKPTIQTVDKEPETVDDPWGDEAPF